MSENQSYYQIICVSCEAKGKHTEVRTTELETKCHECGAILVIESWRIKYVMNPDGKIVDTSLPPVERKRSGPSPMTSVVDAAAPPVAARKVK